MAGVSHSIRQAAFWVPNNQICVGARQQSTLAREQSEDLCRVGAGQGDKLVGCDTPGPDTISPQDRQSIAHTGQSIGYFREIVSPQLLAGYGNRLSLILNRLGAIVEERTVICANRLDGSVGNSLP